MPPDQDPQGTLTAPGTGTQDPTKTETSIQPQPQADKADAKSDDKTLLNKDDKKAEVVVPEKYEYKLPEGFELRSDALEKANTLFKELGLPQEAAQKIIDMYVAEAQQAAEGPVKYWKDMREGWVKEIKADKDLGPKLDQVRGKIATVLTDLGPLEVGFREAMDLTGAGDHPAFIRAMYKWAQMLTEGGHVTGKGPSELGQRAPGAASGPGASALYPNLPS